MLADVPGLIEGASHGAGLGLEFLRHLERTRTLVHVVDASAGVEAARVALTTIRAELEAYSPELAGRPSVVAFNKIDLPEGARAAEVLTTSSRAHSRSPRSTATDARSSCSLLPLWPDA